MKIHNVKIYTMSPSRRIIEKGWVGISDDGIITDVCEGVPESLCPDDIDGGGACMYPGFIDAHTHLGLSTNGVGMEGEDFNEEVDPCTPQLRIIDAINPFDTSFEKALRTGITSVAVSPGSSNPVAGDIAAISTYGKRIDKMLHRRTGIKFALGENPKMTYMDRDETPVTRMATAAVIREMLSKVQRYMQDCEKEDSDPPEYDAKCEALLPLLRGELSAQFHCHRADDIFTAIRIAKEFSLRYTLIHCTDGHLIADELVEEGASAIVGPIICDPCKPELANITPSNAGILAAGGIKTAICTDHSETPIEYLLISAGVAIKHGMTFMQALEAVTVNAAEIAGISDIAGSLEKGKRADLTLFSGSPFEIMSSPELVIIGGRVCYKR